MNPAAQMRTSVFCAVLLFTPWLPNWQSWWLATVCLIAGAVLGGALCQLRMRKLIAEKKLLEEQATARTLELGESNRMLSESQRQLVSAMDAAKLGCWSRNLLTGEVFWDERTRAMFGIAPEETMTFERLLSFVLPEDREGFQRHVEEHTNHEYRISHPDGNIRWLRVQGDAIRDDSGRAVRTAGVVMDITQQRQREQELHALELQLRHFQKFEAVGRLAGGMAHDFNNILMVVQSYTELLQEGAAGGLQGCVEHILKAVARGANLTKQLLAFSSRQVLSPTVLDLNSVVNGVVQILRRLIGEHIELRAHLSESLGTVRADPNQITQALVNLCVNARDAMPEGGTLTLETKNFTMDESSLGKYPYVKFGEYVLLSTADTGTGMSKDVQEHIFEPFFTTKERGKGTGLGLPTVFGIVKQSGGYVWVDSEAGHGTCITICLPRVNGAHAAAAPTKREAKHGSRTLLIAEDEDDLREAVCEYLRGLGYVVFSGNSGEQALAVAAQHPGHIELLITDMIMPKMNGRELAQALEKLHPELKTLYISGYMDDDAVRRVVGEQGANFLQKPFSLSALANKVREVLGRAETP
jgi:PAS domain S-box-containing protein